MQLVLTGPSFSTSMDIFSQSLAVGRRSFDDPFFDDGNKACNLLKRMCVFDVDEEELCHSISREFFCEVPGCMSTFETLLEFEVHYNTLHRYVCSVCHKILPSPHFLDLHIEENHDSFFSLQAERKPMYQCLVEDCKTKFWTVGERKDHCLKTHSFPPNFRWFVPNTQKAKSKGSKPKPKRNMDTEMGEDNLNIESAEATMEELTCVKTTSQLSGNKQKKKRGKKHVNKVIDVDLDNENSANSVTVQECTSSEMLTVEQVVQQSKKSPAPFKGFIPRNVNANRTFHQKSYFKGRDWHQATLPSSVPMPTSSLESGNLSKDLRGSLPTDMEET